MLRSKQDHDAAVALYMKHAATGTRRDADEAIFFARELEHVKSQTFDIKFPMLKHRSLLPVDFSAGPAAETITYRQFTQLGVAQLIAHYADDLKRADVNAKEFVAKVKSLAMSYGWNLQEVRAAAMTGKPLNARRASAARRGHMIKENDVAWFGDADAELQGFLTNPNIITVVLPADGVGAQTTLASKTPDQKVRDLNSMATAVHDTSKGVESPDTLLLPIEQFNLIFTDRLPASDISVGRWFLDNSPHIKQIDWLNELDGTGAGGTDIMVVYRRSADALTLEIPQEFEQLPVQERNLEFIVPTHSRLGGVLIYYPLSIARADGV